MLSAKQIEDTLTELKPFLSQQYNVEKIGYFGSFAKNNASAESDLDILVEFSKPIGWEFFTLEKFLEDTFSVKVDLVTRKALKERLKNEILATVKYL